jgi:hypothetical protein
MNVKFRRSSVMTTKQKLKEYDNRSKQKLKEEVNNLVPGVYASLAIALHRNWGWGFKRINRLFSQSQRIWEDLGTDNIIELCEKETNILLKGE